MKPKTLRNAEHLKFIRSQPCCVCNKPPQSEAAHVRAGNQGGMGLKPSDYRTVPLCHDCHAKQHSVGEGKFWDGTECKDPEVAITSMLLRRTEWPEAIDALVGVLESTPRAAVDPEG